MEEQETDTALVASKIVTNDHAAKPKAKGKESSSSDSCESSSDDE